MTRLVERALTDVEYGVIVTAIDSAPTMMEAIVVAVKATMNALMSDVGKTWDTEQEIDPTQYAVPEDQWLSLLSAMQDRAEREGMNADTLVSIGLQWVNYGPSAVKT